MNGGTFMEKDKTVYVELLAALKTIKANGLEAVYVEDQISILEELIREHEEKEEKVKEPEDKPLLAYYKGAVVVFTDGGAKENPGPSGCSCIIDAGDYIIKTNKFLGNGTNNEAEYSGVLLGINKIIELGIRNANVHFLSDSQLVVNQLSGRWRIKDPRMRSYVDEIRSLLDQYEIEASFTYIPREKNLDANLLTLAAIDGKHVDETLIKES
jgi:ribonuclease HI